MDVRFFEEQVLSLEQKLYRIAYSILWNYADAQDALQECIMKAWQKQASLRVQQRFDPWITRILVNECRNIQRKNKTHLLPLEEAPEIPTYDAPVDTDLQHALRALPAKYRLPILLHYMNGHSLQEISTILFLPLSTIKGRLYQGRKLLKKLMEEEAGQ